MVALLTLVSAGWLVGRALGACSDVGYGRQPPPSPGTDLQARLERPRVRPMSGAAGPDLQRPVGRIQRRPADRQRGSVADASSRTAHSVGDGCGWGRPGGKRPSATRRKEGGKETAKIGDTHKPSLQQVTRLPPLVDDLLQTGRAWMLDPRPAPPPHRTSTIGVGNRARGARGRGRAPSDHQPASPPCVLARRTGSACPGVIRNLIPQRLATRRPGPSPSRARSVAPQGRVAAPRPVTGCSSDTESSRRRARHSNGRPRTSLRALRPASKGKRGPETPGGHRFGPLAMFAGTSSQRTGGTTGRIQEQTTRGQFSSSVGVTGFCRNTPDTDWSPQPRRSRKTLGCLAGWLFNQIAAACHRDCH